MGRPLAKDVNGVNVLGSPNIGAAGEKDAGILVTFWNGSSAVPGGIVKQRGAKTYVVSEIANFVGIADIHTVADKFTCTLIDGVPSADGEMSIQASDGTYIAKMTKRVMTDFSGNRYKWEMVNFEDSTGDAISLTPIV